MTKTELRKQVKSILTDIDKDYLKTSSDIIAERIINSEDFQNSRVVFIYVSTENEPATDRIIETALVTGKTVCVPKCVSESGMKAVRINSLSELKAGKFGIREPMNTDCAIDKEIIDTAYIPCVAASYSGKRLGHGAGYYDRFLENTGMKKIVLCFDRLISEDIPTDSNDIKADIIITENVIL